MSDINVLQKSIRLIVGMPTRTVSVVQAGPVGPAGVSGAGVPVGGATGQVLQKASGTDFDTEWADRPRPSMEIPWHAQAGNLALTNSPLAERFIVGQPWRYIKLVPMAGHTQVRLVGFQTVASASPNTPRLRLVYKTGGWSTTIGDYTSLAASGDVEISLSTVALQDSGWVDLAPGAVGDILVGLTEQGGDGAEDPAFGYINVYFR